MKEDVIRLKHFYSQNWELIRKSKVDHETTETGHFKNKRKMKNKKSRWNMLTKFQKNC